jgi:hypothetical protein
MAKLTGLTLLIACCLPWPQALAHPFHISVAEMEYNPQTKKIEVSLKLHAVDFERALSQLAGRTVNVDKQPIKELASAYLSERFYLVEPSVASRDASVDAVKDLTGNKRSQLHFVGHELQTTWLWLYFELQPPETVQDLWLVNTVLFETTAGQINTVTVRHHGKRVALKMTEKEPRATFDEQWLQSE